MNDVWTRPEQWVTDVLTMCEWSLNHDWTMSEPWVNDLWTRPEQCLNHEWTLCWPGLNDVLTRFEQYLNQAWMMLMIRMMMIIITFAISNHHIRNFWQSLMRLSAVGPVTHTCGGQQLHADLVQPCLPHWLNVCIWRVCCNALLPKNLNIQHKTWKWNFPSTAMRLKNLEVDLSGP